MSCCVRLPIVNKIASTDPVCTRHLYAKMHLPRVVVSGGAEAVVSAKAVGYCIYRTHTQKGILCLVIRKLQLLCMTCRTIVMMSDEDRNYCSSGFNTRQHDGTDIVILCGRNEEGFSPQVVSCDHIFEAEAGGGWNVTPSQPVALYPNTAAAALSLSVNWTHALPVDKGCCSLPDSLSQLAAL